MRKSILLSAMLISLSGLSCSGAKEKNGRENRSTDSAAQDAEEKDAAPGSNNIGPAGEAAQAKKVNYIDGTWEPVNDANLPARKVSDGTGVAQAWVAEGVLLVVGDNGSAVKISDGGKTLRNFSIPGITGGVNRISFLKDGQGWLVADNGILMHSSDAGDTWQAQQAPAGDKLVDVSFINDKQGVVLSSAQVSYTADAGQHWTAILNGNASLPFDDLKFVGEKLLLVRNGFQISISKDLGKSWTVIPYISQGLTFDFLDENFGYLAGVKAQFYVTKDGGDTAESFLDSPYKHYFPPAYSNFKVDPNNVLHFTHIKLMGDDVIWLVANWNHVFVGRKSTDGSWKWDHNLQNSVDSLAFFDAHSGSAVGRGKDGIAQVYLWKPR